MKYYKNSKNEVHAFELDGSQDHLVSEDMVEISIMHATRILQEGSKVTWEQIKNTRNQLLRETDWTDLPNTPVDNRPAWLAYRQKLRDVTKSFGEPWEVVWPIRPS